MVLWIRSQDRTILLPINNKLYIPNSKTGEDFGIFYEETMLGHYKKRERALKVLDEIQGMMSNDFRINDSYEYNDLYLKTRILNTMVKVYELPEE